MWWISTVLAFRVDATLPADGAVEVPVDSVPVAIGDFDGPVTAGLSGPGGDVGTTLTAGARLLEIDAGLLDAQTAYVLMLTPEVGDPVQVAFTTGDGSAPAVSGAPTLDAAFTPGDCITGGGLGTATADFAFPPVLQDGELAFAGFVFPDGTEDVSWVDGGGSGTVTATLNAAVPYAGQEVCAVAWVRAADGERSAIAESCVVPPALDCDTGVPEPEKGCGCSGVPGSPWLAVLALVALAARRQLTHAGGTRS